jgi:hypothetical protein
MVSNSRTLALQERKERLRLELDHFRLMPRPRLVHDIRKGDRHFPDRCLLAEKVEETARLEVAACQKIVDTHFLAEGADAVPIQFKVSAEVRREIKTYTIAHERVSSS